MIGYPVIRPRSRNEEKERGMKSAIRTIVVLAVVCMLPSVPLHAEETTVKTGELDGVP